MKLWYLLVFLGGKERQRQREIRPIKCWREASCHGFFISCSAPSLSPFHCHCEYTGEQRNFPVKWYSRSGDSKWSLGCLNIYVLKQTDAFYLGLINNSREKGKERNPTLAYLGYNYKWNLPKYLSNEFHSKIG